jgi:hypothetical protein
MRSIQFILIVAFILLLIPSALSLTASIGNSRMILRIDPGEEIERSILIKNVNDVPVTINALLGGDLKDQIELEEDSFLLAPGEEKKLFFTITSEKAGTFETKINVQFEPEDGNSVGLTSTIILIAGDPDDDINSEEEDPFLIDNNNEDDFMEEENLINTKDNKDIKVSVKTNSATDSEDKDNFSLTKTLLISTIALMIILIILFITTSNSKPKKNVIRKRE